MKKVFLIYLIFVSHYLVSSQETIDDNSILKTEKDSAYYKTYNTLKALYIIQTKTPEHLFADKLMENYKSKWRSSYDGKNLGKTGEALNWIKENLEKTKFSSYEEAVQEHDAVMKAFFKVNLTPEGRAFSEYSTTAILTYGPEIYTDVVLDVMGIYHDNNKKSRIKSENTDTEIYKLRYAKLRELAIAYFDIPSVAKAREAQKQYNAKWTHKYATNEEMLQDPGGLKWIEKNLQNTKFTSVEQAKKEYEEVSFLAGKEATDYATREYKDYLRGSKELFGIKIAQELIIDLQKNYPDKYY